MRGYSNLPSSELCALPNARLALNSLSWSLAICWAYQGNCFLFCGMTVWHYDYSTHKLPPASYPTRSSLPTWKCWIDTYRRGGTFIIVAIGYRRCRCRWRGEKIWALAILHAIANDLRRHKVDADQLVAETAPAAGRDGISSLFHDDGAPRGGWVGTIPFLANGNEHHRASSFNVKHTSRRVAVCVN